MTPDRTVPSGNLAQRYLNHAHRIFIVIFAVGWVLLIAWGWSIRDEDYISASSGLGYVLGLAGGIMMLLLLTYSLRKRWRPLRSTFHIKYWFRTHMLLGVLAPTAILFHSRFSFGSPNSTVALVCLLTVAVSGLIGRFLYNRIHAGVYGEKIKLVQVRRDFQAIQDNLMTMAVTPDLQQGVTSLFESLDELLLAQKTASFGTVLRCRRQAHQLADDARDLLRHIEKYHEANPKAHQGQGMKAIRQQLHENLDVMLVILKKLPGLHLFDRLFSLWHVVHLPIFGLMLLTVITHVIVVHMY